MSKKVVKKVVVAVPKSLNEAAQFLAQIGEEQRAIDKIQMEINTEIERLKAEAMENVKPHKEKISQLIEGLFAFAEIHRDELTENGKFKTVKVPTGTFGWRMTPPAVSLRDIPTVLKNLKLLGLGRFIRIREEVDKEAILREPEVVEMIKGVSISQHEEFIAKPAEIELEIATQVDRLKKKLHL